MADKLIKEQMKYSLSDDDLRRITSGICNVYEYKDILRFNDIDELLEPNGCAIILYNTDFKFGHYTCLLKFGDTIEFFDSLALPVDWELLFVKKNKRKLLDESEPHLSKLLAQSPYKIIYNKKKLQKFSNQVSTCGRWCAIRVALKDVPLNKFQNFFLNQSKSPDYLVTAFTLGFI